MNEKRIVNILIVEDNADDARMMVMNLSLATYFDYRAMTVQTAADMRRACKDHCFDVVLLDLYLPNGAGTSLIREVRELVPNAALVVITGHSDSETEIEARWALANDFLPKATMTNAQLLKKIDDWSIWSLATNESKRKTAGLGVLSEKMNQAMSDCEASDELPPFKDNSGSHRVADVLREAKKAKG